LRARFRSHRTKDADAMALVLKRAACPLFVMTRYSVFHENLATGGAHFVVEAPYSRNPVPDLNGRKRFVS
jgi:hypothetical protein